MTKNLNQVIELESTKETLEYLNSLCKSPIERIKKICLLRAEGSDGVSTLLLEFMKKIRKKYPNVKIVFWDRESILYNTLDGDENFDWGHLSPKDFDVPYDTDILIIDDFHLYYEQSNVWQQVMEDKFYNVNDNSYYIHTDRNRLVIIGYNEKRSYNIDWVNEFAEKCDLIINIPHPTQNDIVNLISLYSKDTSSLSQFLSCTCNDLATVITKIKAINTECHENK